MVNEIFLCFASRNCVQFTYKAWMIINLATLWQRKFFLHSLLSYLSEATRDVPQFGEERSGMKAVSPSSSPRWRKLKITKSLSLSLREEKFTSHDQKSLRRTSSFSCHFCHLSKSRRCTVIDFQVSLS